MLSPVGARAVTSWETEQLSRVSGCCPPQGRELLPKDFKFAIDDIVAVPRRGASCYRKDSDLDPLEELLSPVGARAVTSWETEQLSRVSGCCPPQGRELLPKDFKFAIDDIVAVPRRGASCYRKDSDLDPLEELLSPVGARAVTAISDMKIWFARSCCPPQGRELLPGV